MFVHLAVSHSHKTQRFHYTDSLKQLCLLKQGQTSDMCLIKEEAPALGDSKYFQALCHFRLFRKQIPLKILLYKRRTM